MTREVKQEITRLRRGVALTLHKHGKSIAECARITGYSERTVKSIISADNGQHKREAHAAMRAYKAEGHTHQEVADKFGVSVTTATVTCKGIAPQKTDREYLSLKAEEQHQKTLSAREEKARKLVAETGFEYVGGYVNTDSFITIRCPECGNIFERSMITFRHHAVVRCPFCPEIKKRERKEELRLKREQEEQERTERKRAEEERKRAEKLHPCPVCGEMTTRNKYCSKKCANRAANSYKEVKRRAKLNRVLVDKDITLERLYERDHGICYLCGKPCDRNDREEKDGAIICGDNYPSIDHVVPLAKGGEHSWQNVRLAHRVCNYRKSDN